MFKRSRVRGLVVLVGIIVFAVIGYIVLNNSKAATNADIDNNGSVGISDLTILAANYGLSGKTFSQGDITGDGTVNIFDFSILAAQWGQGTASCTGVTISSGQSIQTAVNNNTAITTFCIKAGTYVGSITPKSGNIFIGETGAIIDGLGTASYGFTSSGGSPQTVTIKGLTIRNFVSGAIKPGYGWTIDNNDIYGTSNSGIAIEISDNIKIINNKIHDNQWYAINGGPSSLSGSTFLIENNEVYRNNLANTHGGDNGATKFHGCTTCGGLFLDGLTLRGNNFHDNIGHGIWTDGLVKNTLIENNTASNNTDVGIFHEIGDSIIIRNNTLSNNMTAYIGLNKSCIWGAQIDSYNGHGVQIYGNTITVTNGTNGVCIINNSRPDPGDYQSIQTVSIHDNNIYVTSPGVSGLYGNIPSGAQTFSMNSDHFFIKVLTDLDFSWGGNSLSWTAFRSQSGQESSGTIATW